MPECGLGAVGPRPGRREIAFTAACGDERSGVHVVGLDGGRSDQLLVGDAYGAAWSPDGEWLATARLGRTGDTYQLAVVRADGSDLHVIDTGPEGANNPTWGPSPSP